MLDSGGIVHVLEIGVFCSTEGDEILGEISEENAHERLIGRGEMENGCIGGREYLSCTGCSSGNDTDGIDEKLVVGGIADMGERVGGKARGETLPEELCERYRTESF